MKATHLFVGTVCSLFALIIALPSPVLAGRYVINQSPETLSEYFGEPINISESKNGAIYTYSSFELREFLPQFKNVNLSVLYVNSRAKSISFNLNGEANAEEEFDLATISRFYNYIFGYQPSIFKRLARQFSGNETIATYQYCLGDGVAASFTLGGYKQFLSGGVDLFYESKCEPPYVNLKD
ncbi:hypothetical protein [Pseudanabaena sp. lw0831]|uniref:hypothetical protein n=1 Tax=Pseudanabaena sp. lw0831 TaxID=1357935 RepID=UPI0019156865|nr:hypothetical protein [Pseudanabaena sp. lw0831]